MSIFNRVFTAEWYFKVHKQSFSLSLKMIQDFKSHSYKIKFMKAQQVHLESHCVTGRSTGSPRFGLEPKANTESPTNRRSSVIGEAALSTLSTWGPAWGREPVSARQRVRPEEPVPVYSSPPPAPVSWAEQISILSWLWLHVCSIDLIESYICEAQSVLS